MAAYANPIPEGVDRPISPERLSEMASSSSSMIRSIVAKHSSTSEALLRKMSRDRNEEVIKKVAENKNTPLDVLERLAKSENFGTGGAGKP
jgi:arsenate reductase-like glutaredoxin family protein